MRCRKLLLQTLPVATSFALVSCRTHTARDLDFQYDHVRRDVRSRNIVASGATINDTYDFVIAGGGLAGLVLASRLSEDSNTTVLVLEAGASGDAVKDSIDIPSNAYFSSLLGTSYDWQYQTVPQTNAGNRVLTWPRGKVLGGSSAVNGMYLVRPSQPEVDAWADLISPQDNGAGASAWSWESLFQAMKKSETFNPPSDEVQAAGAIQYDTASHGTSGPLHYAYPGYILPVVGNWTATLEGIGIPASPDSNAGKGWGAFIATSSINPSNWTRSYSRSAYIEPLPPRSNLDILADAQVTKIVFASGASSNFTATGVQYAAKRGDAVRTVNARKEVLLAGGAVGSPQLLMHSGIGPKDMLKDAGVDVLVDLPGVGQHLQDHISSQVVWKTSSDTAASIHQSNATNLPNGTSSPFLSFINSATAYANVSDLLGPDFAPTFQKEIQSARDQYVSDHLPSTDAGVIAGYKSIYTVTSDRILMSEVGQVELLFSLTGTAIGGDESIAIQAALQHPLSQGRMYINSSDPFDAPVIDPNYLSHSADTVMLREGLKLARKLGNTDPLMSAVTDEISPGKNVSSDNDWDQWLATAFGTEFHPSCTCAMLPQNQGGVVDANLKVYGLANVRVIDSSVYPIQFAAHLQAPTYGLAEQGALIIRALYNGFPPPSATTTSHPTAITPSPTSGKNGASSVGHLPWSTLASVIVVTVLTVLSALLL